MQKATSTLRPLVLRRHELAEPWPLLCVLGAVKISFRTNKNGPALCARFQKKESPSHAVSSDTVSVSVVSASALGARGTLGFASGP